MFQVIRIDTEETIQIKVYCLDTIKIYATNWVGRPFNIFYYDSFDLFYVLKLRSKNYFIRLKRFYWRIISLIWNKSFYFIQCSIFCGLRSDTPLHQVIFYLFFLWLSHYLSLHQVIFYLFFLWLSLFLYHILTNKFSYA